jgi:ribosomal protein S18 acetylase RimI-like enzyme
MLASINKASVRLANPADTDAVVSVLREAAQWLVDRGMPLWEVGSFTTDALRANIERGEVVVAEICEQIGGVALRQWEDRVCWPDREIGEAGYIHKLAVKRNYAGQGMGNLIVGWVEQDLRVRHRKFLRLDCAPRNALMSFYEKMGFRRVDERTIGTFVAVRFEKSLE